MITEIRQPSGGPSETAAVEVPTAPQLSVIVPAYREGKRIRANLERLLGELDKLAVPFEVIVVSDGNIDATASEARKVQSPAIKVFEYPMNAGKGFALSLGVSQSTGPLVTFIDADMELDPANIKGFIDMMHNFNCDAVIGSKRHPLSEVSYPRLRRIQSFLYQLLVRVLFHLNVRDTQTGLKLFRREVLQDAVQLLAIKRFAFDLELVVVSRFLGYERICEAPIKLDYRFESTVNLRSAFDVLWDTAAIFYRLRILRYYARRRELLAAHSDAQAAIPDS